MQSITVPLLPPPPQQVSPEPDDPFHHQQTAWQSMTRTVAHYERYEQIGEGTYGQVYRARCKDTGQMVALKKMRIHHGGYWGMPLQLIREIKILKRLHHPNLLHMIEVVTSKGVEHLDDDDPPSRQHQTSEKHDKAADVREAYKGNLFLVLEYVEHDLTGLMDVGYQFTPVEIKCIFRQLLEALAFMHEHKYVHRDIKSSNILINAQFQLKLADFGLARSLEPPILDQMHDRSSSLDLTNKVITLWYRPPEILVGGTQYTQAVDVWSAGCILAELILGKPLFTGKTEIDQLQLVTELMGTPSNDTWQYLSSLKRVRPSSGGEDPASLLMLGDVGGPEQLEPRPSRFRDKYEAKFPETALNLLVKLLEWDPRKRMTAQHAVQNKYFWTQPVAPENPAEAGWKLVTGPTGHFHEFQTKKKRREAKAEAEKAKEKARHCGATEDEAQDEYDKVYRELMKKVAEEGFSTMEAKPSQPASTKVNSIAPVSETVADAELETRKIMEHDDSEKRRHRTDVQRDEKRSREDKPRLKEGTNDEVRRESKKDGRAEDEGRRDSKRDDRRSEERSRERRSRYEQNEDADTDRKRERDPDEKGDSSRKRRHRDGERDEYDVDRERRRRRDRKDGDRDSRPRDRTIEEDRDRSRGDRRPDDADRDSRKRSDSDRDRDDKSRDRKFDGEKDRAARDQSLSFEKGVEKDVAAPPASSIPPSGEQDSTRGSREDDDERKRSSKDHKRHSRDNRKSRDERKDDRSDRDRSRGKDRSRDRDREREERDRDRGRDRDRDRERERNRGNRESGRERDRDRERERERDRVRDRERERDRNRDRERYGKDRDLDRSHEDRFERARDVRQSHERESGRERSEDRDRDRGREFDREREWGRDRERGRNRDDDYPRFERFDGPPLHDRGDRSFGRDERDRYGEGPGPGGPPSGHIGPPMRPSPRDGPTARDGPMPRNGPAFREGPIPRDGPMPRDGPAFREGPPPPMRDLPPLRDGPLPPRDRPPARDGPPIRDRPFLPRDGDRRDGRGERDGQYGDEGFYGGPPPPRPRDRDRR